MRVVLVDPSRTMRLFVTRLLAARDHEVLPFADGPEALARMHQDLEVAALITSAELGAMSGLELCWETRVLAGRDRPIYVSLMSSSMDKSRLGEEFAILLEGQTLVQGVMLAEELRARIATLRFDTANGAMTLTCSFGVSARKPDDSVDDLLKRADVALY